MIMSTYDLYYTRVVRKKDPLSQNGRGEATSWQHSSAPRQRAGEYKTSFESQRQPLGPKHISSSERAMVQEQQPPTAFPRRNPQQSLAANKKPADPHKGAGLSQVPLKHNEKDIAGMKGCAHSSQHKRGYTRRIDPLGETSRSSW